LSSKGKEGGQGRRSGFGSRTHHFLIEEKKKKGGECGCGRAGASDEKNERERERGGGGRRRRLGSEKWKARQFEKGQKMNE